MALTNKQQAFVNAYLRHFNATKAAVEAGYSKHTARSIGAENLTKPDISVAIKQRMTELTMSADEAMMRLTDIARGSIEEITTIKHGIAFFDMEKAEAAGKLHLVKEIEITDKGVKAKLYDAQAALGQILKEQHLRAGEATERIDGMKLKTYVTFSPDDWDDEETD